MAAINFETLERAVRHELAPVVNRNAEALLVELKSLVEKVAEKGTILKKNGYLIGKSGAEIDRECVTFTKAHADAVINHLDDPATVQAVHGAVSLATKGRNLEVIAVSAQEGRGLPLNQITYPIADSNLRVMNELNSVPSVPRDVMAAAVQEMERTHGLKSVVSQHIGAAAAQARGPVREAIIRMPEGPGFLDTFQVEAFQPAGPRGIV